MYCATTLCSYMCEPDERVNSSKLCTGTWNQFELLSCVISTFIDSIKCTFHEVYAGSAF